MFLLIHSPLKFIQLLMHVLDLRLHLLQLFLLLSLLLVLLPILHNSALLIHLDGLLPFRLFLLKLLLLELDHLLLRDLFYRANVAFDVLRLSDFGQHVHLTQDMLNQDPVIFPHFHNLFNLLLHFVYLLHHNLILLIIS